tara:strand:- start:950 stop:1306 length:357 start_codon:yes stop_codon:yes gene_type:complete
MKKPVFANKEHEIIIGDFIAMHKDFVRDVSNDMRWKNYVDVLAVVVEYHNNYGKGTKEHNYWDWLMILPINVSVLTNGFLAAVETKRNQSIVRSYKIVLNELVQDVVNKIEKLEPIND